MMAVRRERGQEDFSRRRHHASHAFLRENPSRPLRHGLRNLHDVPEPGRDLRTLLAAAVTDSYHRKAAKRARYRPPNPDKKPLAEPKLRKLTRQEKKKLHAREEKLAA